MSIEASRPRAYAGPTVLRIVVVVGSLVFLGSCSSNRRPVVDDAQGETSSPDVDASSSDSPDYGSEAMDGSLGDLIDAEWLDSGETDTQPQEAGLDGADAEADAGVLDGNTAVGDAGVTCPSATALGLVVGAAGNGAPFCVLKTCASAGACVAEDDCGGHQSVVECDAQGLCRCYLDGRRASSANTTDPLRCMSPSLWQFLSCFPACQPGLEGCSCNPTGTPQGTCVEPDLSCIPTPTHSCVKLCSTDADCRAGGRTTNTLCRKVGLPEGAICVDQEAGPGEVARRNRNDTGSTMVGCADGLRCVSLPGLSGGECSCAQPCTRTASAPNGVCGGARPYCSLVTELADRSSFCEPNMWSSYEPPPPSTRCALADSAQLWASITGTFGVCSARLREPGAVCNPRDATEQCDSTGDAPGTVSTCVTYLGATPEIGLCLQACPPGISSVSCKQSDPALGSALCVAFDSRNPQVGVCSLPSCSNYPPNCAGVGAGAGRRCEDLVSRDVGEVVHLCTDVLTPLLSETTFRFNGAALELDQRGDDCRRDNYAPFHCPPETVCVGSRVGLCVRGCSTSTGAPPGGGCLTATSTTRWCAPGDLLLVGPPPAGVCVAR